MPFYPVTFPMNEADGLVIQDLQMQNLVEYINSKNIKSAFICSLQNFDFLEQCKNLEYITIELSTLPKYYSKLPLKGKWLLKKYDASPVYALENLKMLSIIDVEEPFIVSDFKVDLSRLSKLEEYSGDNKYVEKIGDARRLKSLRLNDYDKDTLDELSGLNELDTLELNTSKIKSLDGCENLTNLQCLYLYYNRSLSDISALKSAKKSLKALTIECCGKIKDFSVLSELEMLESLVLVGSNEVSDISFIKKMKNLKAFTFTINILDGDLTPCLDLQYACCAKGRRYYNLTNGKLPKGEFIRGNENIEMWRRFE